MRTGSRFVRGDLCGLALAGALAAWTSLSALATDADGAAAARVVGLLALAAGAYAAGRLLGARIPWLPAAAVAAGAVIAVVPTWLGGSSRVAAGALGYSNASAELSVQGFAAALLVLALVGRRAGAVPAALAALVLAVATIRSDSIAATGLLVLPAATVGAAAAGVSPRRILTGLATLLVVALAGTVVLGATGGGQGSGDRPVSSVIDATLSGRRIELWHDALVLMAEHPLLGVGPDRFSAESPTARADRDARWAHNGFLQQGAETGLVGLALLLGIFLWGLGRLGGGGAGSAIGAIAHGPAVAAGAAVAALGIHACVDYVLHFPTLPVAAAAILGSTVPRAHRREVDT